MELQPSQPDAATQPRSDDPWQTLLHSRGLILGMLFLVTGALGIPVLLLSPVFSAFEKLFWSAASTIYTALLLWGTWMIMVWSYRMITGAV